MTGIDIDKLLEIGISLSGEKNCDKLLYTILTAAMDITNCDGGTLYILENSFLEFRVMINRSMGIDLSGDAITMPPVPLESSANVCSNTARAGKLVNIPDVYNDNRFDFSGTRRYDQMTGYKTGSLLCLPMKNDRGEIIGVLQLINALNEEKQIIPFDKSYEKVVMSLSSQSAICLTNRSYAEEISNLFDSFIQAMSTAIDARSPYNASHTKNMVKYGKRFMDWLEETGNEWHFDENSRKEFLMSVWLHDVGKLTIPLEVMDKSTRLGSLYERVKHRLEVIGLCSRLRFSEGKSDREEYECEKEFLMDAEALIEEANKAPFITDEMLEKIKMLSERTYSDQNGNEQPWLSEDETEALSVRRGTLTDGERALMQDHVTMTCRMLNKMKFSHNLNNVPIWAAMHHEFINGKGYPNGLSGDILPREVRLLTILDIFDALTACDRPYKKAMPVEAAFGILGKMCDEGQIDGRILELFRSSNAYIDINSSVGDDDEIE